MGAFVGYSESNHTCRIWNKEKSNIITICDVRFLNKVCDGGFDLEDDQDKDDDSIAMVTAPIGFLTARQIVNLPDYHKWCKAID
jgi:hypothetical protein